MRSILFKAKKLSDGKWVKGSLVKTPFGTFIEWYEDSICNKREVDTDTVCQSTGLKDCEGNEIWKHDLLQSQETKAIYEVVWNQGNTSFSLVNTECPVLYPNTLGSMLRNRRLKVVGNKF
jgi:hypothetical protein